MDQQKTDQLLTFMRNVSQKLIDLDKKITKLDEKVTKLANCNSNAFQMCKKTISALAENQESVYDELMESAGKIQAASWTI